MQAHQSMLHVLKFLSRRLCVSAVNLTKWKPKQMAAIKTISHEKTQKPQKVFANFVSFRGN
jgi:hypothetical protein